MKSFLKSLLYLLVLFSYENSGYALSENQIKKLCEKNPRRSSCIENLKFKKLRMLRGDRIEIPVIPFKK